jgi:periplasmic protein TonB
VGRAPKAVSAPDPEYSQLARLVGFEGGDVLILTVNSDGSTGDIQILQPLGFGLDEKAVEAVRRWKFQPANMDGRPVPTDVTVGGEFSSFPVNECSAHIKAFGPRNASQWLRFGDLK